MPSPYPAHREGRLVEDRLTGFPLFFSKKKQRIITSDPFALMEKLVSTELTRTRKSESLAYVEQASDFYDAASAPRLSSKPLLYYYSFLNLEKALLTHKGVELPPAAKHGIADPRVNFRERFRLEGQNVLIMAKNRNKSEIFPELVNLLEGDASQQRQMKFLNVVSQIPSVHRTYTQVSNKKNLFCPICRVEVYCSDSKIWARIAVKPKGDTDKDLIREIKKKPYFSGYFSQVSSAIPGEQWFETTDRTARGQGVAAAYSKLAKDLRSTRLSTLLTPKGYLYYLSLVEDSEFLPPLAAATAAIFYLGSITRYKPATFDKIRAGKFGWLCEELMATLPLQIVYSFASEMAGVDVVKPLALVRS